MYRLAPHGGTGSGLHPADALSAWPAADRPQARLGAAGPPIPRPPRAVPWGSSSAGRVTSSLLDSCPGSLPVSMETTGPSSPLHIHPPQSESLSHPGDSLVCPLSSVCCSLRAAVARTLVRVPGPWGLTLVAVLTCIIVLVQLRLPGVPSMCPVGARPGQRQHWCLTTLGAPGAGTVPYSAQYPRQPARRRLL